MDEAEKISKEDFDAKKLLVISAVGTREYYKKLGLARAEGGETRILELEAYPGFTEAQIGAIAETARTRFDLQDLMIVHRIGQIAPGEPVVFVATAASHRRAAFEACDYLMDYLKSRAPFWKKEHGPEGARWVEPRPQDHEDIARLA